MTEERSAADLWQASEDLFSKLVDLSESEQDSRIDALSAEDPELATAVRRLLEADRRAGTDFMGALDPSLHEVPATEARDHEPLDKDFYALEKGDKVGAFRVERPLGRGGMGEVYLARRSSDDDEAFEQLVALKMMRFPRASGGELRARFLRERRILARLAHPSIAGLIEAGTDDGTPFLAMEFVEGIPITSWAEENSRDLRSVVELFLQACRAVQFAHENLVIHRDIKPSNVLVTESGFSSGTGESAKTGAPRVKLLDFGIAALLEGFEDGPALTASGVAPATPEYSAPEQLRGEASNTATDVFGLGVLLFELLSGHRPENWPPIGSGASHRTPPAPVVRASLGPRQLPRDLVAIVQRAIDEDPERRYNTVSGLILDLESFLNGRPVAARRGNRIYRAGKFARRHWVGLAALAAVASAVVAGSIGVWFQGQRAQRNAERAERVTEFLVGVFEASDPAQARGRTVTALELLERGTESIGDDLAEEPMLRGEIQTVLGRLYRSLGSYDVAESHLDGALELLESSHADPSQVATTLAAMARVQEQKGDLQAAKELLLRSVMLREDDLGPDTIADRSLLALLLLRLGEKESGIESLEKLRAEVETFDSPLERGEALAGIGDVLLSAGEITEAESTLRAAVEILGSVLQAPAPRLTVAWTDHGIALFQLGRHVEAAELFRAALRDRRLLYDEPHIEIAHSLRNLSGAERALGETEIGLAKLREALAMYRELFGDRHPDVAETFNNLAVARVQLGDLAASARNFQRSIDIQRDLFGGNHPGLVLPMSSLGNLQTQLGELEAAERNLSEAQQIAADTLEPDHPHQALIAHNLAGVHLARNEFQQALPLLEQALAGFERSLGATHPNVGVAFLSLGKAQAQLARTEEEIEACRASFERAVEVLSAAPPQMASHLEQARSGLAEAKRRLGE